MVSRLSARNKMSDQEISAERDLICMCTAAYCISDPVTVERADNDGDNVEKNDSSNLGCS